jgi:hypothetical protein
MITFTCKQCDKTFQRPDDAAGTLVFCECGAGNRVPWQASSNGFDQIPEAQEDPAEPLPLRPLQRDRSEPRPRPVERPPRVADRDPHCCLNHHELASEQECAACGETFCPACLVSLTGESLCGPCKNFRLQSQTQSASLSGLAILGLFAGVLSGPATLLIVLIISGITHVPALGYIGAAVPLGAAFLNLRALRDTETKPRVGGRSIAITGLVSSILSGYLAFVFAELMRHQLD